VSFEGQSLRDFSDWFGPEEVHGVFGAKSTKTRDDVRRTVTVAQRNSEETPRREPEARELVSGIVLGTDVGWQNCGSKLV